MLNFSLILIIYYITKTAKAFILYKSVGNDWNYNNASKNYSDYPKLTTKKLENYDKKARRYRIVTTDGIVLQGWHAAILIYVIGMVILTLYYVFNRFCFNNSNLLNVESGDTLNTAVNTVTVTRHTVETENTPMLNAQNQSAQIKYITKLQDTIEDFIFNFFISGHEDLLPSYASYLSHKIENMNSKNKDAKNDDLPPSYQEVTEALPSTSLSQD